MLRCGVALRNLITHHPMRLSSPSLLSMHAAMSSSSSRFERILYCSQPVSRVSTQMTMRGGFRRSFSTEKQPWQRQGRQPDAETTAKNRNIAYYSAAIAIIALGLAYLAVPLYRVFCQVMGIGGTTQDDRGGLRFKEVVKLAEEEDTSKKRVVRVLFTADTAGGMDWEFYPSQDELVVNIGEPTLAFFTAKNNLDVPVVGVATYNVFPNRAGLYFHKVQCFCFDEQRLGPKQEVDMPVMFFLDPEMEEDKYLKDCDNVTLSYTFFRVEDEFDDDDDDDDEMYT